MEVSGKIIHVLETLTGTNKEGKEWTKQGFVIEEIEGEYPKKIAIDAFNKDFSLVEGSIVTVSVNIESREYNGKWYTNVSAWKIDLVEAGSNSELPPSEQINNSEPPF